MLMVRQYIHRSHGHIRMTPRRLMSGKLHNVCVVCSALTADLLSYEEERRHPRLGPLPYLLPTVLNVDYCLLLPEYI